jgi:hypothetical protein
MSIDVYGCVDKYGCEKMYMYDYVCVWMYVHVNVIYVHVFGYTGVWINRNIVNGFSLMKI